MERKIDNKIFFVVKSETNSIILCRLKQILRYNNLLYSW